MNAPKVTKEQIAAKIRGETYTILPNGRTTVCQITLENGFTVEGYSACVSIENFDKELGEVIAYEDAFDKIWQLEGYLLAEDLYWQKLNPLRKREPLFEQAARIAHEVNRAYCQALGDESQPSWEEAPDWQKSSCIDGVKHHLISDLTPEESHAAWLTHKELDGWKWGPVKDPEKKEHPCFLPYHRLPPEQKAKDYIFRAVVRALKG